MTSHCGAVEPATGNEEEHSYVIVRLRARDIKLRVEVVRCA